MATHVKLKGHTSFAIHNTDTRARCPIRGIYIRSLRIPILELIIQNRISKRLELFLPHPRTFTTDHFLSENHITTKHKLIGHIIWPMPMIELQGTIVRTWNHAQAWYIEHANSSIMHELTGKSKLHGRATLQKWRIKAQIEECTSSITFQKQKGNGPRLSNVLCIQKQKWQVRGRGPNLRQLGCYRLPSQGSSIIIIIVPFLDL